MIISGGRECAAPDRSGDAAQVDPHVAKKGPGFAPPSCRVLIFEAIWSEMRFLGFFGTDTTNVGLYWRYRFCEKAVSGVLAWYHCPLKLVGREENARPSA